MENEVLTSLSTVSKKTLPPLRHKKNTKLGNVVRYYLMKIMKLRSELSKTKAIPNGRWTGRIN